MSNKKKPAVEKASGENKTPWPYWTLDGNW